MKIYGGYPAGGGTRDIARQPVVLSGDIGTVGTATDNSYHVMVISVSGTTTDSIVVDGLTIKEGYSIGAASSSTYGSYSVTQGNGAGISITTVSANRKVALRTVTLSYNQANTGGAIYNASRSAYFANCVFTRDTAEVSGGAIYNAGSTATTISGCQFSLNTANTTTASLGGGAIYSTGYTLLDIVNSTFTSNRSFREGGAIMNYVSANTASIKGCTFTSNRSSNPGGAMMNNSTRPVIDSCIFFEQ
ncbi:MAG: hypothetical protein IT256_03280 [Chitinophagaceae bacterium]|nr:hypothetical protein [Chitinophagaceae bacterium]